MALLAAAAVSAAEEYGFLRRDTEPFFTFARFRVLRLARHRRNRESGFVAKGDPHVQPRVGKPWDTYDQPGDCTLKGCWKRSSSGIMRTSSTSVTCGIDVPATAHIWVPVGDLRCGDDRRSQGRGPLG
jgi:hypothetical protein